jgi:hypothetical protein
VEFQGQVLQREASGGTTGYLPELALELWAGYPLLDRSGMSSNNFVVQYSPNLAGNNWMNLLSLSNLPVSPYLFLDPAGDAEPARFYRAFMQ